MSESCLLSPAIAQSQLHSLGNSKVSRRCLLTESDGAEVMSDGRSFQRWALETGKAHLSTVVP